MVSTGERQDSIVSKTAAGSDMMLAPRHSFAIASTRALAPDLDPY